MSSFDVGQRVMVTRFESMYSCDLAGFYGRVTGLESEMVFVALQGCVDTAPDREELEIVIDGKPFPFFPRELEHAD